jgi:hypothetical protein
MTKKFPVYRKPDDVSCFHCGTLAKDARPYRAGADASHRDADYPDGFGRYRFICQCGWSTYYDLSNTTDITPTTKG